MKNREAKRGKEENSCAHLDMERISVLVFGVLDFPAQNLSVLNSYLANIAVRRFFPKYLLRYLIPTSNA